jgi:hypothetical protein
MNLDRAVNIKIELTSRVLDLVSSLRSFKQTNDWFMDEYAKLFTRYPKDLTVAVVASERSS